MAVRRIRPIHVGTIVGLQQPMVTYNYGWGKVHDAEVIMFWIQGGAHPIVVDTGSPDPDWVLKYHRYRLTRTPAQHPRAAMESAGLDPSTVETVIFTHLHWDHCSNVELFPNARFYVQRSEVAYAIDPLEIHRAAYEKQRGITPPWYAAFDRLYLVHGNAEILPGVRVAPIPGHTPGSQGVLVDGSRGGYVIAGDCIDTYENWTGNEFVSHIPSGVHTDLIAYHASFKRLESFEREGYEIIPSHDHRVLAHGPFE